MPPSSGTHPVFEEMLVESGTTVTKLWFSVTQEEQRTRFAVRQIDPVRPWKLPPMDLESLDKWEEYTQAKEAMFPHADSDHAPWTTIRSNDEKRGRIEAMRAFLHRFAYQGKDPRWSSPPTTSWSAGPGTRSPTDQFSRGCVRAGPLPIW